jgi:hypothetical protein
VLAAGCVGQEGRLGQGGDVRSGCCRPLASRWCLCKRCCSCCRSLFKTDSL